MLFFFEYIWMHCEYTSEIIAKEIINILQIGLLFFFFSPTKSEYYYFLKWVSAVVSHFLLFIPGHLRKSWPNTCFLPCAISFIKVAFYSLKVNQETGAS